jgi:hypothetical protein
MNPTNDTIVLVEWVDASTPICGWQSLIEENLPKLYKVVSVGYLIRETDDRLILAAHLAPVDGQDHVMGLMSIPKQSILHTETIFTLGDKL